MHFIDAIGQACDRAIVHYCYRFHFIDVLFLNFVRRSCRVVHRKVSNTVTRRPVTRVRIFTVSEKEKLHACTTPIFMSLLIFRK